MKRILLLGHTDLRVFLKVRSSFVWLFVVPILFMGFMGYAFRGPRDPSNLRPTVLVDNRDTNYLSAVFVKELGTHGLRVFDPSTKDDVSQQITIPSDFTARVLAGEQAKVGFYKKEDTDPGSAAMVELRLVRALIGINSHLLLASSESGGISAARFKPSRALRRLCAWTLGLPGANRSRPGSTLPCPATW